MREVEKYIVSALLEDGQISKASVEQATIRAAEDRVSVLDALIVRGDVTRDRAAITRAAIEESCYADLSNYDIDIRNAQLIPRATADRYSVFVLFSVGGIATVGMIDPLDLAAVDQIRGLLRAEIEPVLCEPQALRSLIGRAYSFSHEQHDAEAGQGERRGDLLTGEEPIVAAVNQLLAQAAQELASDVHINPDEHSLHVRFRIDGSLQTRQGPPVSAHAGIVQRLKVLAHLDLTQTRRPQDGKFRFVHESLPVDVRLSIVPTIHGENVVMRLLASGTAIRGFPELGLAPELCEALSSTMESPNGMFLVTGPTGSGKSTTLYTALKRVNTPDRNVMTIEDPVEIRLPMVRQVQVNTEIGLTFAAALRAILRQDPDVVLLGEIRDQETARIAMQAALTGHLVLATLHTNDSTGAVARLRDLGCPSFAINASLLSVLAQRLVKKVCGGCAKPYTPALRLMKAFGLHEGGGTLVKGLGCSACMSTGYRGRVVVAEFLRMSPGIQRLVETDAGSAEIRRAALELGMKPMWADGVEKARLGLTTLEEVCRAVSVDMGDAAPTHQRDGESAGTIGELRMSA